MLERWVRDCGLAQSVLSLKRHQDSAGKGGVCTLVEPHIKHLVSSVGSLLDNWILWITLANTPIRNLGIANIYASNDAKEPSQLWEDILEGIPGNLVWILGIGI